MNPAAPASTPAPLNDIVGPVWFWPYPLWMTIAAGLVLIFILGALAWGLKKLLVRKATPPSNRQKALAALEVLRSGISGADPYAFGVTVSDAIRVFLTRVVAVAEKELPFAIKVPNATSQAAMAEANEIIEGRCARFTSADA